MTGLGCICTRSIHPAGRLGDATLPSLDKATLPSLGEATLPGLDEATLPAWAILQLAGADLRDARLG